MKSKKQTSPAKNIAQKKEPANNQFAAPSLPRIFASMVYDTLLLAAISIAYGALVVGLHVLVAGQPEVGQRVEWSLIAKIIITVGWLLVLMSFYIYFWRRFGQTLGMKTWRIQMIDASAFQSASIKQCAIRSAAALFSLAFFGAGYWVALFHPQQRTLHDILSNTQLVLLKKK